MQDTRVAAAVERVVRTIEERRQRAGLMSVVVGVVHDQTLLLAAGFGCANLERRIGATPDTLYRIGSVTKVFEATALMQGRDAGRLRLDDPVDRSVPEVWFRGADGARQSPTWRQLASHTAGLPRDVRPILGTVPDLFRFLERQAGITAPGSHYAYSNLGFLVLGQAVAALAGSTYHEYVRRHIFEPLGMASSTYDIEAADPGRLAIGYLRVSPTAEGWSGYRAGYQSPFPPSGTVLSSANDLSRFLMLQFRTGAAGGPQVLAPATIREMWRPVAPTGTGARSAALGWFTTPLGPYTIVRKDGGQPGFTAFVQLVPERKLGVVALVNESPERVRASGTALDQLVLEELLPVIGRARP